MQVAGTTCHVCGKRIMTRTDGAGCPRCGITFHLDCAPEARYCPKCGDDYRALARDRKVEEREEQIRAYRKGRSLVLVAVLVLMVPATLLLLYSLGGVIVGPRSTFYETFPRAMIGFLLFGMGSGALCLGYGWARHLVQVVVIIGMADNFFRGLEAVETDLFLALGHWVWLVVLGFLFFLVTLSPAVSFYLDRRS